MAKKSIRAQIEEKYGIAANDLKAVVFYSDRSWSRVHIFGDKQAQKRVESYAKDVNSVDIQLFSWDDLREVPEGGSVQRDAAAYGFHSGCVLLVPE